MLHKKNNKYLVVDDKMQNEPYNSSYHSIMTYFVLNGLSKVGEGIAQQIYASWFEKATKMINQSSSTFSEVWNSLLTILNDYFEPVVILVFPNYFLKIDIVSFTDDEFPLEEFLKGHVLLESENQYLTQYMLSKFQGGRLTQPKKCMNTIREFSDNRYLSIDFEKVFEDRLKPNNH